MTLPEIMIEILNFNSYSGIGADNGSMSIAWLGMFQKSLGGHRCISSIQIASQQVLFEWQATHLFHTFQR